MRHVGLCGSDLNTFRGRNPLADLPRVPGHEIGGRIVETGAAVPAEVAPGANAIIFPNTNCGTCTACRKGRVNACQFNATLGVQRDGGMSDFLCVPWEKLILNDVLLARHLALIEPLSVGFHAIARDRVYQRETVVVLGGGIIGVGAMLGALERGAEVIADDISEAKSEALLSLGGRAVIDPGEQDALAAIRDLTGGNGADVTVKAVGLPETFLAAVDLASFAGRGAYVGHVREKVAYDTAPFNLKELDMYGSRNATREDFEAVIAFVAANPEPSDRLILRVFFGNDTRESFAWWESNRNKTFKAVVEFPEWPRSEPHFSTEHTACRVEPRS
ncbi:threonine dehydrogenase-like Zn-dependent dehydrogenase [Aliiruegeria haliotis]|uniref:Threonine dehydrogenase-like Zn-dependent dehydrogenase n=1 Tax=Aliiruegeria haliotis TaxID=1280846 RepID=A0A2T0RMR5_9RHOB|nr:threonine dehydrogenase-like Zn-dependent dehydrogenase [Aliiruegeria haliotis]